MIATHYRAYAGADVVATSKVVANKARLNPKDEVTRVVFYGGGEGDDEFVILSTDVVRGTDVVVLDAA